MNIAPSQTIHPLKSVPVNHMPTWCSYLTMRNITWEDELGLDPQKLLINIHQFVSA